MGSNLVMTLRVSLANHQIQGSYKTGIKMSFHHGQMEDSVMTRLLIIRENIGKRNRILTMAIVQNYQDLIRTRATKGASKRQQNMTRLTVKGGFMILARLQPIQSTTNPRLQNLVLSRPLQGTKSPSKQDSHRRGYWMT